MSRITVVWHNTKNAFYMTNGITESWCDPNEYNDTKSELEDELLEYESRS